MENTYVRTAFVELHQSTDYAHVRVIFGCAPAGSTERTDLEYFRGYDTGDLRREHYLGMPEVQSQQNRPQTEDDFNRGYPAYAWEDGLGIITGRTVELNEAKAAAAFLTKIDRNVQGQAKRSGIPAHTFGLYVFYLCRAMKIKQVSVQHVDSCGMIDGRYLIDEKDLGQIVKYIDDRIMEKRSNWNQVKWTTRW